MEELYALKKMRLFKNLQADEISQIRTFLKTRRFKKGTTIIDEGAGGSSLFIVKKGELKVTHFVRGRRRELGTFRAGDHFGEISFIDRKPRSASIHATKDSELLQISRRDFARLLRKSPTLQIKLMNALLEDLCGKLRNRKFALDFDFTDLLPVAIFEADKNGNITFANRTAMDSFGYSADDFTSGPNLFYMIASEDRRKAKIELLRIMTAEGSGIREYKALTKDGKTFPVMFHVQSMTREAKKDGVRVTIVNISDRIKVEKALQESFF